MTVRHSRPKNGDRCYRQKDMGTQTPKAAGSSTSQFQPDPYQRTTDAMDIDITRDASVSAWSLSSMEGEERPYEEPGMSWGTSSETSARDTYLPPIPPHQRDIPDQLADLLISMLVAHKGQGRAQEFADAFLNAHDTPPVTKQSLCELDIQSIITNMKLRHDVNFDRDLSFRPNFDGPKGHGKKRIADQYWNALVAELILYERLYQGPPLPRGLAQASKDVIKQHAERRLPKMFHTIREVLRSLVPDRDHSRVDEHLDVLMLMQEIERGVCDLVKLTEWIAGLLKEHCAPMRDILVDGMCHSIRQGIAKHNHERPELIVQGLRELLGILEAMKLDVANHQIRNLKPVLIEDTVKFENHYHLERLINRRSRVGIDESQRWYADAIEEFGPQCRPPRRHAATLHLECFTRAAIAPLFSKDGRSDFPETFYLDYDRLHALKAEINDLICTEVCTEMFIVLARQFGYHGPITPTIGQKLRNNLSANLGAGTGLGLQQWMLSSGPLSIEILREAASLAGKPQHYALALQPEADHHLRILLKQRASHHAARVEALLLPRILDNVDHHATMSPMDLFHNLVPISPAMPPPPTHPSRSLIFDTTLFPHLHPETARLTDLANRIAHILLLHWRIWGPIAYIQYAIGQQAPTESPDTPTIRSSSSSPLSTASNRTPLPLAEDVSPRMSAMKTGELPDAGQETPVAHDSRSPRSQ